MTQRFVASLLFVSFPLLTGAQPKEKEKIQGAQKYVFGIHGGPLSAFTHYRDADFRKLYDTRGTAGFSIGGSINFPTKNGLSFQTELGYAQAGRTVLSNETTWKNKATYRFADMGMLLRKSIQVNIKKNVVTNIFFSIGPNIKYWLGGNGTIEAMGPSQSYKIVFNHPPGPEYDRMYMNDVNRWLFGIDAGVGFEGWTFPNQKVTVELRYTHGQTYFGGKNSAAINLLGFQDNLQTNMRFLSIRASYHLEMDNSKRKMGRNSRKAKRRK
ncbi:MAG: PorT family protein [Cyclobacteriaceae bacterium]|nr:PorT family protein [Cyclobacteriaceae bacterium]